MLYGNNTESDIIFKADLDDIKRHSKNFRVVYTLTSPGIDKKIWPGRTGYIDAGMIKEEIPDSKNRVFYICGPPAMAGSLVNILKDKLGIREDRIKLENFTGY